MNTTNYFKDNESDKKQNTNTTCIDKATYNILKYHYLFKGQWVEGTMSVSTTS